MGKYCLFYIVTSSVREADISVNHLLGKKLINGANIIPSKAQYKWRGKIVKRDNYIVAGHVAISRANKIITEVKKLHVQKVPAISFLDVKKANTDFLRYLNTDH
jgi:uncharacterized protein involved in tolerance to divalent cations